MTRTPVRGAGALALALMTVVLVATPAQAAAYRYWTYWQADGAASPWTFATEGPGTSVPADGTVEGWRFAVTAQQGSAQDAPRLEPSFAAICGTTEPVDGSKRVGLVVDSGPAAIAPAGELPPDAIVACAVVPVDATGFEVLETATRVRTRSGLICALGDYPRSECTPVLEEDEVTAIEAALAAGATEAQRTSAGATAPAPAAPADSGTPVATIAVAILLLAGVGIAAVSRRRTQGDPRG